MHKFFELQKSAIIIAAENPMYMGKTSFQYVQKKSVPIIYDQMDIWPEFFISDALSEIYDVRIIWGGDSTISEFRKSSMKSRTIEMTFVDRYSLAVIDSNTYLEIEDKKKTANYFTMKRI